MHATGSSILREAHLGVDPFTSFTLGLSTTFNVQLGIIHIFVNGFFLLFVFWKRKSDIGIGTLLGMVSTGFLIQYISPLLKPLHLSQNVWTMILALTIGVALFSLGTSFEMLSDLGKSPYDSVAPIISDNRHIRYRYVRLTQDIIVAVLAFYFHGPIGIGTLVCATCNGIFISNWRRLLKKTPMYKHHIAPRTH
ncbi:YczE/YyaS/YitT family protein [Weissella viridescens]|uniref:YczE/YyaS/YitT family protein n=1 Tax=Weissella viridescens TaxID=1629 RepID=UPI00163B34FA|nr:YitT family protein [Weissella viridescens]